MSGQQWTEEPRMSNVEESKVIREPKTQRHEGGLAAEAAAALDGLREQYSQNYSPCDRSNFRFCLWPLSVGPSNGMDNHLSKPDGANISLGLKDLIYSFIRMFQLRSDAATDMVTEVQSPARDSKSNRRCHRQLSARERDMMEFSPRGDVTGVQYEDGKGLGGCRLQ